MKFVLSLSLLVYSILSFDGAFAEPSKILGIHPLMRVLQDGSNVSENYRPYLDAFGMIRREVLYRGVCTATHLGNGYVLSAGHCFGQDLAGDEILIDQPCDGNEVHWGGRGEANPNTHFPDAYLISQCTRIVYSERIVNEKNIPIRDFALFKVDEIPAAAIAPASNKVSIGTKISTFSYPQHRPLEWSSDCDVAHSTRSVFMFWHQCDTEGGSSGSTMLALNALGIPEVVGIHNGSEKNPAPFNYATDFSSARAALMAHGIDLDKLLSEKPHSSAIEE